MTKNNTIKYTPKKSFKGMVSVRSYIVDKAIRQGKDLIIEFEGKNMIVPNERLKDVIQLHTKKFKSQYDGKEYELHDFFFTSDTEKKKILTLF